MNNIFKMNICTICLAVDVRVTPLGNVNMTRFIQNIFENNGFNQKVDEDQYACYKCKAYIIKSYKFIQRALRAQKVLYRFTQQDIQVSIDVLKKLDRKQLGLDSDLSIEILYDININQKETTNSKIFDIKYEVDEGDGVKAEVEETVGNREDSDSNAKNAVHQSAQLLDSTNTDIQKDSVMKWEEEEMCEEKCEEEEWENELDSDPLANVTAVPHITRDSVLDLCNKKGTINKFDNKNIQVVNHHSSSLEKIVVSYDDTLIKSGDKIAVGKQNQLQILIARDEDMLPHFSNKRANVANKQKKLVENNENTSSASVKRQTNKKQNLTRKYKRKVIFGKRKVNKKENLTEKFKATYLKKKKHDIDEDYKVESTEESESSSSDDSYDDTGKRIKKECKSNRRYPRKCDHCDFEISLGKHHYHHYLQHHAPELYPYQREQRFVCEVCGVRSRSNYRYQCHMLTHGERTVKCPTCPKTFHNGTQLLRHKKRMHTETRLICNYCDKQFKDKESITRHIRLHTGERPFKCHICGAGYAHKGNLGVHIRSVHQNCRTNVQTSKQTKRRNVRRGKRVRSDTESDCSEVEIKRKTRAKTKRR